MKKIRSPKKLRLAKSTLRSLSRDETRAVNGASAYVWCNGPVVPNWEAPKVGTVVRSWGIVQGGC